MTIGRYMLSIMQHDHHFTGQYGASAIGLVLSRLIIAIVAKAYRSSSRVLKNW